MTAANIIVILPLLHILNQQLHILHDPHAFLYILHPRNSIFKLGQQRRRDVLVHRLDSGSYIILHYFPLDREFLMATRNWRHLVVLLLFLHAIDFEDPRNVKLLSGTRESKLNCCEWVYVPRYLVVSQLLLWLRFEVVLLFEDESLLWFWSTYLFLDGYHSVWTGFLGESRHGIFLLVFVIVCRLYVLLCRPGCPLVGQDDIHWLRCSFLHFDLCFLSLWRFDGGLVQF